MSTPPSLVHCPHCLQGVATGSLPGPALAMRCPSCRLVIAAGRGIDAAAAAHRIPFASPAALSGVAARRRGGQSGDPDRVAAAVWSVARIWRRTPAQLRMLEYRASATEDADLPSLEAVLATFGTWRATRNAVVRRYSASRNAAAPRDVSPA